MISIWSKTLFFLSIMFISYSLKRMKLLRKEYAQILGNIIIYITLPCVFFSNAKGVQVDMSFLGLMGMGLLANILLILLSHLFSKKEDNLLKGTYMIACSGYDVGNFILPFVSTFYPGVGVIYLSSFNVTNTIMCLGFTYAIAYYVAHKKSKLNLIQIAKQLFSSISFDVYILILIIAIFHIDVPDMLIDITEKIGSINTYLVMIMIGLKLEFNFKKENTKHLVQILSIRFIGGVLLTFITLLLPLPKLAKTVIILAFFGPLVSVSSIYAKKLGYEKEVVAESTTISILISMMMSSIILSI